MSCSKVPESNPGGLEIAPEFVTSLVNVTIRMDDMLAELGDSGNVATDPNGFLVIHSIDRSIRRVKATDILKIPNGIGINNTKIQMGPATLADRSVDQTVSMNAMMTTFDASTQSDLNAVDGTTDNYPSFTAQSGGGHSFANISDFEWASILTGNMALEATNNPPADVTSLSLDVVDATTSTLIGTYNFPLLTAGASLTGNSTLIGKTFNKNLRLDITAISCSGTTSAVAVDLNDGLEFEIVMTSMLSDEGEASLEPQVLGGDSIPVSFSLPNDEEATRFLLASGDIDLEILSDIGADMELVISFPQAEKNGNSVSYLTNVSGNQTTNMSHGLDDVDFDLSTDPTKPYNVLPVRFNIVSGGATSVVEYNSSDEMDVTVKLNDLEYDLIEGDFGYREQNPDVADIVLDVPDFFGSIKLYDPVMQLLTFSSFGFEILMDLDFDGFGIDSVSMNTTPQTIPYPSFAQMGQNIPGSIIHNNMNSDIEAFMENIPSRLSPKNGMKINPDQSGSNQNFLTGDGYLELGYQFDMPVQMGFNNFGFETTEEFTPIDLGVDTIGWDNGVPILHTTTLDESIEYAYFHVNTLNGFGTDVNLVIYLMDDFLRPLDSIPVPLMTSASVDANGGLISPTFVKNRVELETSQLAALSRATNIRFRGYLNTPPQGNLHIHSNNYVKIYTGVEFQIKTTLE